MLKRTLSPLTTSSFFLFGARGTGKSTWARTQFKANNPIWIDLLDTDQEDRYSKDPKLLEYELLEQLEKKNKPDWVIIDEIQKVPRLLDIVHRLIENQKIKFVLTGSSARKLKRNHANLLGGRASLYALYPFTHTELGENFSLDLALNYGTLPRIYFSENKREKITALRTYAQTYLKEEILIEQLVRNLVPFKGFLEISAQMSAKRLNYEKISRDIGVDNKTVQSYFDILEETYLGFRLPSFHLSIRKSQLVSPKFYWFDLGIQRYLAGTIHSDLVPSTSAYGDAFEAFIINEFIRANSYFELDYSFSYLQTKNGPEIDLILSRGKERIAIEIKSYKKIDLLEVKKFEEIAQDLPGLKKMLLLSQDPTPLIIGNVHCVPWKKFFLEILPNL